MKVWEEQGKWNFSHKIKLLQAEEKYSLGSFDDARELYKQAIAVANEHRFVNDLALSYELAAHFFMSAGDLVVSYQHFTLAHKAYADWGAMGKARLLFDFINQRFNG